MDRPMRYPTAWSYSRWATYAQCPLKYKWQVVDKAPFKSSPAMERGNRIHIELAQHVSAKARIPVEIKSPAIKDVVAEIRAWPDKIVEKKWAFDNKWGSTGYFSQAVWLRAILDVMLCYDNGDVEAVDWKTGRRYDDNDDQMELFALATMWRMKAARTVTTRLVYVDTKDTQVIVDWPRADWESLTTKWVERSKVMLADRRWGARPNDKCKWCQFGKDNGGPCFYG